ncbi:MAG: tetratricopeptide repeat protein [Shewanella sp.]
MIQLRAISRGMICGLLLSQLCSCSSTPLEPTVIELDALFDDSLFKPVTNIPSVEDIFSLPSSVAVDVKRTYDRYAISTKNPLAVHEWLASYINANQEGGQSDFRYQDNLTQTASETYAQRAGNCMSLVVMTSALADIFNIGTEFQDIAIEPVWDKQGDFYLINGHVNLRLLPAQSMHTVYVSTHAILVDFMPERALRGVDKVQINRQTLTAMFYNNMAAESLVEGDLDRAYALVKAGLKSGHFIPALNTLAVIYRHKGDEKRAELVYRYALKFDPDDMTTLFNLAVILGNQGRLEEWAQIHKKLELARIRNPYYYYDMGEQAYDEHQYREALAWYQRAVDKADYRHEFFFGLSRTYWALGDEKRAKQNMEKALALSREAADQHRYQAKLQAMRQH